MWLGRNVCDTAVKIYSNYDSENISSVYLWFERALFESLVQIRNRLFWRSHVVTRQLLSMSTLALSTPFSTSGSNPSQLFSSVSTGGESNCSAYPSSASSLACSSLCYPSSPTCIACKSPGITLTASSNPKSISTLQSSVLYSSPSVSSGLDAHHTRACTRSCLLRTTTYSGECRQKRLHSSTLWEEKK